MDGWMINIDNNWHWLILIDTTSHFCGLHCASAIMNIWRLVNQLASNSQARGIDVGYWNVAVKHGCQDGNQGFTVLYQASQAGCVSGRFVILPVNELLKGFWKHHFKLAKLLNVALSFRQILTLTVSEKLLFKICLYCTLTGYHFNKYL